AEKRETLSRKILRPVVAAGTAAVEGSSKLVQRVNEELYKRNAELRARNKTLALLRKLDEISIATLSMADMAEQMSGAIAEEFGYDLATVAVVEEAEKDLRWLALASSVPWIDGVIKTIDPRGLSLPLVSNLAPTLALEKRQIYYADHPAAVYPEMLVKRLTEADQSPEVEEVKHTVLFPLRFGQQVLGLLTLSSSRPLQETSRYERESVGGIVGLVSLAMYKAKIYEDLQETTAKLAEANDQLKDIDKAKSEFLSIASHQLYTPLTALRGYLSMLQEGDFGQLPEKQAPIVNILEASANRLITLIKNLLDVSRIEAGRLELKLESIDLVEMSKQLVQDLMPNAMAKNLDLQFHAPSHAPAHVVADRERIRQVMLNFVDNAIKYTPHGKIDIRVEQQGDTVVFAVRDTGKGLKPEEIRRLFTKFTRVGESDRLHTEGTGLGLYVAQQIVWEHHGEVKAESEGVDKGSTFSMKLPIEGSPPSLKVGERTSVEIKAAESKEEDKPIDK
ncbi:MAG: GAF domain-containing sensor histidine kinase, partial [Patescibacteria group bacterium]